MTFAHNALRRLSELCLHRTLLVAVVLALAFELGRRPAPTVLALLIGLPASLALLRFPLLGFFGLFAAALVVPLEISTGTEVNLNSSALLVPVLILIWFFAYLRHYGVRLPASRPSHYPLALFLLAAQVSLFIGNVCWDPAVPRPISSRTSYRFTRLRKPCVTGQLRHSLRRKLAVAARQFLEQHIDWSFIGQRFLRLVEDVANRHMA